MHVIGIVPSAINMQPIMISTGVVRKGNQKLIGSSTAEARNWITGNYLRVLMLLVTGSLFLW
ncbi:hypothetical protein AOQ84DRAFT_24596 [Glonium stellatum]|uniref:Uncharacterized protein n=1 Tax=Glonium stellatum TaxID=574774 RepID=A0A8E2F288_9PEZI|nr:hypothetical protein AOQ84DRAFT_24596 [Glonium stellatum]